MLIGDVGDVIHLLRPEQRLPLNATDALFHAWAVAKHELTPSQLGCASWADCHYLALNQTGGQNQSRANPRLYYYINLWAHDWGIAKIKNVTLLAQQLLPAARIGANLPCMIVRRRHQYRLRPEGRAGGYQQLHGGHIHVH